MSNDKMIESTKYLIEQLKPRLGKTYTAGENIYIDENNVISATAAVTDPDHNPYFYMGESGLVYQGLINASVQRKLISQNAGDKFIAWSNDRSSPAYNIPIIISRVLDNVTCEYQEANGEGSTSQIYPGDPNKYVTFNNQRWYYSTNPFDINYGAKTGGEANYFSGNYSSMAELATAILNRIYSIEAYVVKGRPETFNGNASGYQSQAFGTNSNATGDYSTAATAVATASGNFSFAAGNRANASGFSSMALGYAATASGENSVAIGNCTASGNSAVSCGGTAYGNGSFTAGNGYEATAYGANSSVIASQYSRTQGEAATSIVAGSTGSFTTKPFSAAIGCENGEAQHQSAAVIGGKYLRTSNDIQVVCGKYNAPAEGSLLVVGCGTNEFTDRRNILEVYPSSVVVNGSLSFIGQTSGPSPVEVECNLADLVFAQDSHKEGEFPLNTDLNWSINPTGNISMSGRVVQINITTLLDQFNSPIPINTILGTGCPPAHGVARFICMDSRGKAYFLEVDNEGKLKVGNPVPITKHDESFDVSFFGSGTYVSTIYANQWNPII